ncbi:hypothetical protein CKAN_01517700 [Cinnamomum micranthum f. kanehirae]|uniref:Uncharacterized protein n=1 Tax=Cinnamomum micranthum f. kanehirae TaxID=337451 RepID=A0A443P693_9MAGN|nr:hypothetical protein CKAN_01517700 [Cinnamomum micranthum f. kanehirae]
MMSLRTAPPAEMRRRETRPLGGNSGEGTSGTATPNIESILRDEVLQLSELMREKVMHVQFAAWEFEEAMTTGLQASFAAKERDLQKELQLRDAIIDALMDTYERDKDLAASEAVRIRLEGELRTLRTEMDRLRAEACDKCDQALAEKNASEAQVKELQAKLKSFEASTQGGAIVASAPSLLSLSEDRARIHDQYAERMDRMQRCHEEVVADLRRRLDRYRQRAE